MHRGCPAGTHLCDGTSSVMRRQSANSCSWCCVVLSCWRVVVCNTGCETTAHHLSHWGLCFLFRNTKTRHLTKKLTIPNLKPKVHKVFFVDKFLENSSGPLFVFHCEWWYKLIAKNLKTNPTVFGKSVSRFFYVFFEPKFSHPFEKLI